MPFSSTRSCPFSMELLRDLRASTRLLFLFEVTTNRHTRLRTIAERLDMTVQGASEYAHGLQKDGLLTLVNGEYRATKRGVDHLHDRLGLFMENGLLMAYAGRTSPSTGVAAHDAAKGELLAVRNLEGIVALRPGRIVVARVPPGSRGRTLPASKRLLRETRGFVVAALDPAGLVAARDLGLRPRIEFGAVPATVEAAERGVDVLLLLPEERAMEAIQAIEAANARLEDKIPYESVALG